MGCGQFFFETPVPEKVSERDKIDENLEQEGRSNEEETDDEEEPKNEEVERNDETEENNDNKERSMNTKVLRAVKKLQTNDDNNDDSMNPKVMSALKKLQTSYNTTLRDVVDFAFVGGTMEGYDNPTTFEDAWHHPNKNEKKIGEPRLVKNFMIR